MNLLWKPDPQGSCKACFLRVNSQVNARMHSASNKKSVQLVLMEAHSSLQKGETWLRGCHAPLYEQEGRQDESFQVCACKPEKRIATSLEPSKERRAWLNNQWAETKPCDLSGRGTWRLELLWWCKWRAKWYKFLSPRRCN